MAKRLKIKAAGESRCSWFLLCDNPATGTEPHPILGDVPICDRCAEKLKTIRGNIRACG